MAHDFNNLLTAIQGHTELALAEVSTDETVHEDLVEIRNAAQRAARVTRQLLAFSRKQLIRPDLLDLNAVVASMESMLRPLIGEHIDLRLPLVESAPSTRIVGEDPIDGPVTALIVEPEDGVRAVARRTLRMRGYTVIEAATGPEALRVAELHEGPIHLLLTNPVMPRLAGTQLAIELARTRPRIRVLYMGRRATGRAAGQRDRRAAA